MPDFRFRCPTMGTMVQGSADDEGEETGRRHYVIQECVACGGLHLVNPRTGRLMSDEGAAVLSQSRSAS